MLRELRVLGIGDLCAVRSLDIGAVELLFEGRAHIGQILLAQSVALGGFVLGQTDGLGLFCQRVDAVNFGFFYGVCLLVVCLFSIIPHFHSNFILLFRKSVYNKKVCNFEKDRRIP